MIGSVLFAALALNFSVKTSLYDMVGLDGDRTLAELRSGTEGLVVLIADSERADLSMAAATAFIKSIPEYTAGDESSVSAGKFSGIPALTDKVCREDAELLKSAAGREKIAKRAVRRYISSPLPWMFPPEEDPFCLKERFLRSFVSDSRVILPFTLKSSTVDDLDELIAAVEDIRSRLAIANAANPDVRLMIAGVPVHTAITAGGCKRQIGSLTWFSLGFIALLSVFVFRSVKWIPLLALSLLVACLAGAAAVFCCFDSVHILTLVFGTTVLGLVIDYSFHWLLAPVRGPELKRNLLVSWVTTEISLVPLMLSTLPVLRETAVFLAVALAAALAFVMFAYPKRAVVVVALVAAMMIVTGCDRVRTDPKSIYRPPAELAEADRILAVKWTMTEDAGADIEKLYTEQTSYLERSLGIKVKPRDARVHAPLPPQELLERMLDQLTRETLQRLAMALGLMFLTLVVVFRRRALRIFLPSALTIVVVLGLIVIENGAINLFHLLAMFLLAGMTIDYTVFLHHGGREARKPAVCSLLTSMAGFGALYFVSFPVVSAFGLVLGIGLPLAFLLAWCLSPRRTDTVDSPERAASPLGMEILYWVYRCGGLGCLRAGAAAVGSVVWCCSSKVRRAASLGKVVNFTRSLSDKLVVMAEGRRLPKVVTDGGEDAAQFLDDVRARRGVFVLSSHVGTIEVLAALGACEATFHAWMEFERTGVFNRFYLRHARRRKVVIHPIAEFGMQTVFEAGDLIDGGECLLMAGDRGDGAFRFAAAFGHPVYFVACVAEGRGYRAMIRKLPGHAREMRSAYFEILEELKRQYQDQVFEWNR